MSDQIKTGRRGETFGWAYEVYDITAVLDDLENHCVPTYLETTMNRAEIAQYRAFLEGVPPPVPLSRATKPLPFQVDAAYAATLTEADLKRPLIILYVGENEGTIELADLESGYNYVIADGNHRLVRAYHLGVEEIPVVVLLEPVARKYRCTPSPEVV